jgi:hypothetical protein
MLAEHPIPFPSVTDQISEGLIDGKVLLSPAHGVVRRRLLYVDNYGGRSMWEKIKKGDMPPHHLRGCLELVRSGYEVLLLEPLTDFYLWRNPFPHDLRHLGIIRDWLGKDGVIFCGHNVLYWTLFLRRLGLVKCMIISNLWAREPLNLAKAHSGIVSLTAAGAEQARKLAPKVPVAALGWGADLDVYPRLPYRPESFFSCGIALRDFKTMSLAAAHSKHPVQVVTPGPQQDVTWPSHVRVIDSGPGWNFQRKRVSYKELLENHYAKSIASLIILKNDPVEYTAVGFTEIVEALAMARPIIMTRTGAMPTEIDVEKAGCGLFVPPDDPLALARAMDYIAADPERARIMGESGRRLAESRYNIKRYARDLDSFIESL